MQVQLGKPSPAATGVADYFSTLSTRDLQREMRQRTTLPLDVLLNHQGVAIDRPHRRIHRDSFWKGSFAKDNLLGWEERLMTPIRSGVAPFTGGRFWKRFDRLEDGAAVGYIVNYGIHLLPGRATVREVTYPDDRREYIGTGDKVLLLTYRNQPYRIVYDLIKAIDADNCIGVMHLGTFPKGYEFATFVMARNNYPPQKMGVPDHDALFGSAETSAPSPTDLAGEWTGHLIFLRHPELALHNQFNPPVLRATFESSGGTVHGTVRFGLSSTTGPVALTADGARLGRSGSIHEIRRFDDDTLLGRTIKAAEGDRPGWRYVLTRTSK